MYVVRDSQALACVGHGSCRGLVERKGRWRARPQQASEGHQYGNRAYGPEPTALYQCFRQALLTCKNAPIRASVARGVAQKLWLLH